jgi:hypothetical protein
VLLLLLVLTCLTASAAPGWLQEWLLQLRLLLLLLLLLLVLTRLIAASS